MTDAREWFTNEMKNLGFAGLEGVYDYLTTMSDDQSLQYLQSLLGSDSRIQSFANAYIQYRASGNKQPVNASLSPPTPVDTSLTVWASSDGSVGGAGSKKSKRGRGRGRAGASRTPPAKKEEKALFAEAVASGENALAKSEQAHAIKNSPVELARQKVREYRKSRKPVNCIRCGKIETLVREDGACSFCGAALFSIWEKKEHSAFEELDDDGTSSRQSGKRKGLTPVPVVLGRYVFPLQPGTDGVIDAALPTRNLTEEHCYHVNSESEDIHTAKGSLGGFYRNPVIDEKDLNELSKLAEDSLKKLRERWSNTRNRSAVPVPGVIQIDVVAPSVRLHM